MIYKNTIHTINALGTIKEGADGEKYTEEERSHVMSYCGTREA